jgi:hypothetical protein
MGHATVATKALCNSKVSNVLTDNAIVTTLNGSSTAISGTAREETPPALAPLTPVRKEPEPMFRPGYVLGIPPYHGS